MIRIMSNEEAKAVAAFFDGWQNGLASEVLAVDELAVVDRDGAQAVVLMSPDLLDLPEDLLASGDHAGLRIGSLEDGHFALDLQGAMLAAAHTRRLVVRVSQKAAQMFAYGKDILGPSVSSFDPRLNAGDACVVCDPRWEAVGIGEVMGSFKGKGAVVAAVHDVGAYLRDQGS